MLSIDLPQFVGDTVNFLITTDSDNCMTSRSIADLLNLDTDTYNEILIKEVIKHPNYKTNRSVNSFVFNTSTIDIVFHLNDVPKEIYIERFKETFFNELTLLTLGGM